MNSQQEPQSVRTSLTPLMKQYYEIKNQFTDSLVFFQVGDFYEMFGDDAHKAAAYLGITLTKRGHNNQDPIALCGVPVHTVDHYLLKLVKGGFRVVLCNQVSKPQPGKIVERMVTQVLTPGILTDLSMLHQKSASYCAALYPTEHAIGLAFSELMTGHVYVTVLPYDNPKLIEAELARFLPDEIIMPDSSFTKKLSSTIKSHGATITVLPSQEVDVTSWIADNHNFQSFVRDSAVAAQCLGLLYQFLNKNFPASLEHCKQFFLYKADDFLILDAATQRNLELVSTLHGDQNGCTLFQVIDKANTLMGSRQIKKWLLRPLIKQDNIEQRLDAVQSLYDAIIERERLKDIFSQIGDFERLVGRIALKRAVFADYILLLKTLPVLPSFHDVLKPFTVHLLQLLNDRIMVFDDLFNLLNSALNQEQEKNYIIKPNFNAELDRLRQLIENSTQAVFALEQKELLATGIPLKIRYSPLHGYTIEITKTYADKVPPHYIRLQTLTNRERFTTQELKDLEYDINKAQQTVADLEKEIFEQVINAVRPFVPHLKKTAQALAHLDAICGMAQAAYENKYVRPQFSQDRSLFIKAGRHPVIETVLQNQFIANDVYMNDQERLWLITGPNMGGKSTFLRQIAITCILAQMGSFVPSQSAILPIIDRIFTRIGAADNVAAGKSTFFVEMEETALICTQATKNSLVILDEVGRGTSTYDGLAIAQATIEYIYQNIECYCLFATHYHELTVMPQTYSGIGNYHAASQKTDSGVLLLHKIVKGAATGSFGLQVAKDAGIPQAIIDRAGYILRALPSR